MKISTAIIILVFVVVILWALRTSPDNNSSPIVDNRSTETSSTSENQSNVSTPRSVDTILQGADTLVNQPPEVATQTGTDENREWSYARGFTTEYNTQFMQTKFLKREAENGNMLAAQLLGYQMLGSERGNEYLTDAAILGSIQSLIFLSSSSELVADGRLKEQRARQNSEFDQHEYGIRALEYLFVAEIRGDHVVAPNSVPNLMERISYSSQDVSQACVQALEKYAALEQSRLAAGLPPFDNSPPPVHTHATQYGRLCSGAY